jgi:hypothetical protein
MHGPINIRFIKYFVFSIKEVKYVHFSQTPTSNSLHDVCCSLILHVSAAGCDHIHGARSNRDLYRIYCKSYYIKDKKVHFGVYLCTILIL